MANLFGQPEEHEAPPARAYPRYAQVAPEQGIDAPEGLTYGVPDELADVRVGDRVVIPLGRGNRNVSGYVVGLAETSALPLNKLKPIVERERDALRLGDELLALARWISDYYCCPLGMVFGTILPAAVKRGTGLREERLVDLPEAPPTSGAAAPAGTSTGFKLTKKQQAIIDRARELHAAGKLPINARQLAELADVRTTGPVRHLVDKGLLTWVTRSELRAAWSPRSSEANPQVTLNADQKHAIDLITQAIDADRFSAYLVHGVTGSGKTEIYIRAIERVIARGQSAIVLVPEIALTPQTVARFTGRFDDVAVLHSGLTAAQRHEQWVRISQGKARLVVGARSAVFAPVENLGLIVVDEEADAGYKQDQAPRYHGRDVAVRRAQLQNVPVVLGSATPSLESYHNATVRKVYQLIELPQRVADLPLPRVTIVDLADDRRKRYAWSGKSGVHLLSMKLEAAMRETFEAGGQAMLLLNRRGYANYIACPDQRCGWTMRCEHCDVNMVYHLDKRVPAGGWLRCHYCTFENRLPGSCPVCGRKVTVFGLGTQRVEEEIARKFPSIALARMDSDVMRTAEDYRRTLEAFRRGRTRLLLGTQMIAKGLDFPNVRLVGVISADTALNLPDFRAGERTFMLVAQVAGRSGRSAGGGRVIVQTFTPESPAIQLAAAHDYRTFAHQEMELRQLMSLPPWLRMARIVLRDRDHDRVAERAQQVTDQLRRCAQWIDSPVKIDDPAPPPIARIADHFRQQIILLAGSAGQLQHLLVAARRRKLIISDIQMAVDVDPVNLM